MTNSELVLSGDSWDERVCSDWEVAQPSITEVVDAIQKLDEAERSIVELRFAERRLVIGGGRGRFIVYCEDAPDRFLQLVSLGEASTPKVLINIGGQEGEYPADHVVGAAEALEAATYFASNTGSLSPRFSWKRT